MYFGGRVGGGGRANCSLLGCEAERAGGRSLAVATSTLTHLFYFSISCGVLEGSDARVVYGPATPHSNPLYFVLRKLDIILFMFN